MYARGSRGICQHHFHAKKCWKPLSSPLGHMGQGLRIPPHEGLRWFLGFCLSAGGSLHAIITGKSPCHQVIAPCGGEDLLRWVFWPCKLVHIRTTFAVFASRHEHDAPLLMRQPTMHIMIVFNILVLQAQLPVIEGDLMGRQDVVVSVELLYKKPVHCFSSRSIAVL
jgi:hypothetical protein